MNATAIANHLNNLTSAMEAAYAAGKTLVGDAYLARIIRYKAQFAEIGLVLV
jgi:hypothetical protein